MTLMAAARERLARLTERGFVDPTAEAVRRTPSRRGVFLARRTRQACTERKSATRSRRLRTRFAPCVAAPFRRRGDRLRLRGLPVPAAQSPRHAALSRASPRKPGERTRCAILAASSTHRSFSSLHPSPPSDRQYRSPFQSHCFFEPLSIFVCKFSRESKNTRTQMESEKGATDRIFSHTLREGLPNSISACVRLIEGDKRRRVVGRLYPMS